MSVIQNGALSKIMAGLMLSICIGLGAWNLKATHENALQLAVVKQIVFDGKDARLTADAANTASHKRIEDKLSDNEKKYDAKFLEITELRNRLASVETTVKAIELQIIELKVALKAVEVQIAELRASNKGIEIQIVDLKAKILALETAAKEKKT